MLDVTVLTLGPFVRPNPDSCLQSADTPDDSKTDTWVNSEIRIGSCSADQMAIQVRNRVISC